MTILQRTALIIFVVASSVAWSDESCDQMLAAEKELSQKLPAKIDDVTTTVEFSVNCTTRIVKYVKHLSVDASWLAEGFADRKQRQHTNIHCNKQGLARFGWTVWDFVYDKNMVLVIKMVTIPGDCQ